MRNFLFGAALALLLHGVFRRRNPVRACEAEKSRAAGLRLLWTRRLGTLVPREPLPLH
jgi:hypothetical protein